MLLPLAAIPLLKLEVSAMRRRSCPLSLQYHEDDGPNDWNKVEWKIQNVSDQSRRGKLLERLLRNLPELAHEVAAALDLSSFRDEVGGVLRDKYTVERIDQRVFDKEGLAENGKEGAGFGEYEKSGGDGGKGTGCERHDGHLGDVCEDEHGCRNTKTEGHCRGEFGCKWFPGRMRVSIPSKPVYSLLGIYHRSRCEMKYTIPYTAFKSAHKPLKRQLCAVVIEWITFRGYRYAANRAA